MESMAISGSHITHHFPFMEVYSLSYGDPVIKQVLWTMSMNSLSLAYTGGGKLIPELELILLQRNPSWRLLSKVAGQWSTERVTVWSGLHLIESFFVKELKCNRKITDFGGCYTLLGSVQALLLHSVSRSLGALSGLMGAWCGTWRVLIKIK